MPVPSLITDLSTTAGSNSPAGSENPFPDLDNHLRALYAFLASVRDNTGNGWATPYAALAGATMTGNLGIGVAASERLHVYGNGRFGQYLDVGRATSNDGNVRLWSSAGNIAGGISYASLACDFYASGGSVSLTLSTGGTVRGKFDSSGNFIHQVNATAPALTANSTLTYELTSDTTLKIFVRGTDGLTRSVSLTLA